MSPLPSRIRSARPKPAGRSLHPEHARRTSAAAHIQRRCAGFTLLEVLLATGLTATLLVAISAALGLFSRFVTAGQDRVTQSQIQRALGERLRHDIQRVVSPVRLSSSRNSDDRSGRGSLSDSPALGNSTETHRIRRPSDEASLIALRGNERRLAITVHRSGRKTPGAARPASGAERSAVNPAPFTEQVVWQLGADGAGAIVPGSARGGLFRYSSVGSSSALHTPDKTASADLENDETPVYLTETIPEVASLRLRYFDGRVWQSHWNSAVTESLPRAIEVVLQLDANSHDPRTTLSGERYVFPLPREVSDEEPSAAGGSSVSGRMRRTDGPRFSSFSLEGTR